MSTRMQQLRNSVERVKKCKISCISAFLIFLFSAPDSSYTQDETGSFIFEVRIPVKFATYSGGKYTTYLPQAFSFNLGVGWQFSPGIVL